MLVLSRKRGESVSIDGGITVKVIEIRGTRVKLGFECPEDVRILRSEITDDFTGVSAAEICRTVELVAT